MSGFEHYCGRSDAAEAALFNLAAFGHLSGENRARMGWPESVRIRAFTLSGDDVTAQRLADVAAARMRRQRPEGSPVGIPEQRQPSDGERIVTRSRKSPHWGDLDERYRPRRLS